MGLTYEEKYWASLREAFVYWAKKKLKSDSVDFTDPDGNIETYKLDKFTSVREAVLALASVEGEEQGNSILQIMPTDQYPESLPPEGYVYLYLRPDNKLYIYNDQGEEILVSGDIGEETEVKGLYEVNYLVQTLDRTTGINDRLYLYKDTYGYAIYRFTTYPDGHIDEDGSIGTYTKEQIVSNQFVYILTSDEIIFVNKNGLDFVYIYTEYLKPVFYTVDQIRSTLPTTPEEGKFYMVSSETAGYSIIQYKNEQYIQKQANISSGIVYQKSDQKVYILESKNGVVSPNKILTTADVSNTDILQEIKEIDSTQTSLDKTTLSYKWNGNKQEVPFYLSYLWYSKSLELGQQFDDYLDQALKTTSWAKFNGLWISNGVKPDLSGWTQYPTVYSDYIQNAGTFIDGLSGTGFRLFKRQVYSAEYPTSVINYDLVVDNVTARKSFRTYEYSISKTKASNDSLWISNSAKINKVENLTTVDGEVYRCYVSYDGDVTEDYVPFDTDDVVRCSQRKNDSQLSFIKYYSGVVKQVVNSSTTDRYFDISGSSIDGTDFPKIGDEIVKIGNTQNTARQGAIYLTSNETFGPYIDILDGINSSSFLNYDPDTGFATSAVKARFGNLNGIQDPIFDVYGGVKGYGVYIPNGYFRGKIIVAGASSDLTIEEFVNQYVNQGIQSFEDTISENQEFIDSISNALNIDSKVEIFYQSTDPSLDSSWGTQSDHKGDLWFNVSTNRLFTYQLVEETYNWQEIKNQDAIDAAESASDALNLADGKATTYVGLSLPVPPYNIGDVWMQGSSGSLLYSTEDRPKYKDNTTVPPTQWDLTVGSQDYNLLLSDWVTASKYSDEQSITNFIDTLYKPQEDGVVETWFGNSFNGVTGSPDEGFHWGDTGFDTKAKHEGDIWYYQALNSNSQLEDYAFRYTINTTTSTYYWKRVYDSQLIATLKSAKSAEDTADSKRRIFTTTPTVPYDIGDLWTGAPITYSNGTTGIGILAADTAKSSTEEYSYNDWKVTNDYVNDSTFESVKEDVDLIFSDNVVDSSEMGNLYTLWNKIDGELQNLIYEATGRTKELWDSDTPPANPGVGILITDPKIQALIKEPNIGSYRLLEYYITTILDSVGNWINLNTIEDINNPEQGMTSQKINQLFEQYYIDYNSLYILVQDTKTGNYEQFVSTTVSTVQGLVDGKIDAYFQVTDPKLEWAYPYTEHDGDMWYKKELDGSLGELFTYDTSLGTDGQWVEITDSTIVEIYDTASRSRDTIDSRRRIFYATPVPPYDKGDMWVTGEDSDILRCITSKKKEESFNQSDWNTALNYSKTVSDISSITESILSINTQLDGKIETWYRTTSPNQDGWVDGSTDEDHVGDLWLDTSLNSDVEPRNLVHIFTVEGVSPNLTYSWQSFKDPDVEKSLVAAQEAQDTADGKRTIFTQQPTVPYSVGDMWIGLEGSTEGKYLICITAKPIVDQSTGEITDNNFDVNDWTKADDYTTYKDLPDIGNNLISNLQNNWTINGNTATTTVLNIKPNYNYTISINQGFTIEIKSLEDTVLLDTISNITDTYYTFKTPDNTDKIQISATKSSGFTIEDLRIKLEEGKRATIFSFSSSDIEDTTNSLQSNINDILSDGILTPSEQSKLQLELLRINNEYWKTKKSIEAQLAYKDGLVVDVISTIRQEITQMDTAYSTLINYGISSLQLIQKTQETIESADNIIPTTISQNNITLSEQDRQVFTSNFDNYYKYSYNIQNRIDSLMTSLSDSLDGIMKDTIATILGNNDSSKTWTWDDWATAAANSPEDTTLITGGYLRTNLINANAISIIKEDNTVSLSSLFDMYSAQNTKTNSLGSSLAALFTDAIYGDNDGTLIVNGYLKTSLVDTNSLVVRDASGSSLGTLITGGQINTDLINVSALVVGGQSLPDYIDTEVESSATDIATEVAQQEAQNAVANLQIGVTNLIDYLDFEQGDIDGTGNPGTNVTYNNFTARTKNFIPVSGDMIVKNEFKGTHNIAIFMYNSSKTFLASNYIFDYPVFISLPAGTAYIKAWVRRVGSGEGTVESYQSILSDAEVMVSIGNIATSSYVTNQGSLLASLEIDGVNLLPASPAYYVGGNYYNHPNYSSVSTQLRLLPEYAIKVKEGDTLWYTNFNGYSAYNGWAAGFATLFNDGVFVRNSVELGQYNRKLVCDGTFNEVRYNIGIIQNNNWSTVINEDSIKIVTNNIMITRGDTPPLEWSPCPLDLIENSNTGTNVFSKYNMKIGGKYLGADQDRTDRLVSTTYIPTNGNKYLGVKSDGIYSVAGAFYTSNKTFIAGSDIVQNNQVRQPDGDIQLIPEDAVYYQPVVGRLDDANIDYNHFIKYGQPMVMFGNAIPNTYVKHPQDVVYGKENLLPQSTFAWRQGRTTPAGVFEAPGSSWGYANINISMYQIVPIEPNSEIVFWTDYAVNNHTAIVFVYEYNSQGQIITSTDYKVIQKGDSFVTSSSTYYLRFAIQIYQGSDSGNVYPSILNSYKFVVQQGNTINTETIYNTYSLTTAPNLAPNTNQGNRGWVATTSNGVIQVNSYTSSTGGNKLYSGTGGVNAVQFYQTTVASGTGWWNTFQYQLDPKVFIAGETITVSMIVASSTAFTASFRIQDQNGSNNMCDAVNHYIPTGGNQYISFQMKIYDVFTTSSQKLVIWNWNYVGTFYVWDLKIERGKIATPWCPGDNDITLKADLSNEQMANNLGYNSYSAMVQNAIAGTTVIKGGYLNTALIQAKAITAQYIATGTITANEISAGTITADKLNAESISGGNLQFNTGKIGPLTIQSDYIGVASWGGVGNPSVSIGSRYMAIFGGSSSYFRVDSESTAQGVAGGFQVSIKGDTSSGYPALNIYNYNSSTTSGYALKVTGKTTLLSGLVANSNISESITTSGPGLEIISAQSGFEVVITDNTNGIINSYVKGKLCAGNWATPPAGYRPVFIKV